MLNWILNMLGAGQVDNAAEQIIPPVTIEEPAPQVRSRLSLLTMTGEENKVHIDIAIADYTDPEIINLALLVANFLSLKTQAQVISLIRDTLERVGRKDLLDTFHKELVKATQTPKSKPAQDEEKPCVSPSSLIT